jgi:ATP-dependent Lon protease
MATAIASALSQIPTRRDLAMTGEITLRGRVLPIGGLKEKILAAKRAKLSTVILPKRNKKDLDEIPKHLLKGIQLAFAETMDDVMKIALRRHPKRSSQANAPQHPHNAPRHDSTPVKRPGRAARSTPVHATITATPQPRSH